MVRPRLGLVVCVLSLVAGSRCFAQTTGPGPDSSAPFGPPIDDQQVYVHALLDQLEDRLGNGRHSLRWEGQGWMGTDSNRLWIKSEGFFAPGGKSEGGVHEALYDRPLSRYFDAQAGLRYDVDSDPSRAWAALGIQGLAPQWFDVETTMYISDGGHFAARIRASYDVLFTQRLILQQEVELNGYSKAEAARGTGAGVSELETGLRLRYELSRKLAPYIGVVYRDVFGATARYAHGRGDDLNALSFVAGIRAWF